MGRYLQYLLEEQKTAEFNPNNEMTRYRIARKLEAKKAKKNGLKKDKKNRMKKEKNNKKRKTGV